MEKKRDGGLTPKQARFVEEYLIDLNATRAYFRAFGPKLKNTTCRTEGARLLADPCVKAAVEAKTSAVQRKLGLTQHKVLERLMQLGFADPGKIMKWSGDTVVLHNSEDLPKSARVAVKSVKQTTTKDGGSISVDLIDPVAPLKILAQYTKLVGNSEFGDEGEDGDSERKGNKGGKGGGSDVVSELLGEVEENAG